MKIKCLGCGRRIKAKNTRKRCAECQRQHRLQQYREYNHKRDKEKTRRYHRLYNAYYALRHLRHTHDRSADLTIENGRVKGAVWLESQINKRHHDRALCSCGSLQRPFFVAVENHRTYCFECGGKIVIAFENDYYTITEVCCNLCGLVLPQTIP